MVLTDITSKKRFSRVKRWMYTLLLSAISFLIPLLLMSFLYYKEGFAPFVKDGFTTLSYDSQGQYITYMRYFRDLLVSKGDFTYTLSKTFGGDFLSLYSYYLASPFNLILAFIKPCDIPSFILITDIVKMALSSLFFFIMLRGIYHKNKFGFLIFSIAYGILSYSTMYATNFMWLDGVMILPLIIYGIDKIKRKENIILYCLSLSYTLLCSWYIGFITCMFLALYFIYLSFTEKMKGKERIKFLLRCLLISLIGASISAFVWLGAFLHLSGTKAEMSLPKPSFAGFASLFSGFLENNYSSDTLMQRYSGFFSAFTGVVTLVFMCRYFLNKGYTRRERIATLIFFIVLAFISNETFTNAIFHGGREPNWFPCRYSFILAFFVSFFASRDFERYDSSPSYSFASPLGMLLIVLPVVLLTDNGINSSRDPSLNRYQLSIISLILYLLVVLLSSLPTWISRDSKVYKSRLIKAMTFLILPISIYSSYRGSKKIVDVNTENDVYQKMDTYLEDDSLQKEIDKIKEVEGESIYRMETANNRKGNYNACFNNPMFYSYSGISHYSSTEKIDIASYASKLGYHRNKFYSAFDGGSTVAMNSYLGLKYIVDDTSLDDRNTAKFLRNDSTDNLYKKVEELHEEGSKVYTYRNDKALPLAFIIDKQNSKYVPEGERRDDGSIYYFDLLEYQNEIYKSMCSSILDSSNNKKDIFNKLDLSFYRSSSTTSYQEEDGTYKITGKEGDYIQFSFTVPEKYYNLNYYFSEGKGSSTDFSYYIDGSYISTNSYHHSGIRGFTDNYSHRHYLKIYLNRDLKDKEIKPVVYAEDLETLRSYLNRIRENGIYDLKESSSFTSYKLKGTLDVKDNTKSLLFTIPNEKGIEVKVDGKKVKHKTNMTIFTAIDLDSIEEGVHTFEISYSDNGVVVGLIFSITGIAAMILFSILYKRDKNYYLTKGIIL